MVQDIQFYSPINECSHWKNQADMNTYMPHNAAAQQPYAPDSYGYSPTMYNTTLFPYPSVQTMSSGNSPHGYQGFSIPSNYTNQYTQNHNSILPSGSSTAESNGSVLSEVDGCRDPSGKRRKPAPTIATGRRNLKEENVNLEEADRRDKRRERNRKSAQRCRERKMEKKDILEKQISDTKFTCSKYVELAENVLKAWKQRLNLLNESLPCHNYRSQLSMTDFESVIAIMHNRNKDSSDAEDSTPVDVPEFSPLHSQTLTTFSSCNKVEPYYPDNNDEIHRVVNPPFEQYHHPLESRINYI